MIDEALNFIGNQLNEYLRMKTTYTDIVQMRRMAKTNGTEVDLDNKIVFQLVNIEEERVGKAMVPSATPVGGGFAMRSPELKLNLFILFTACDSDAENDTSTYLSAIKLLSFVVKFFQHKSNFTTENSPSLPASIGQLIIEMHPVSLENQNYLWASLGVKYRPSVVYKVRMITVVDDNADFQVFSPAFVDINGTTPQNP